MSKQSTPILTLTRRLSGTVAQYRFVTPAGAQAGADVNTIGAARVAGVSGDDAPVDVLGTTVIESGAAIAEGATSSVSKLAGWPTTNPWLRTATLACMPAVQRTRTCQTCSRAVCRSPCSAASSTFLRSR